MTNRNPASEADSEADSEAGPEAPSKPAPKPDLTPWQLARMLPAKGRIMGLDVGTKTVGIAVSDELRRVATPVRFVPLLILLWDPGPIPIQSSACQ